MRMKYTMAPYPNTHVLFYNGRLRIIKEGQEEFVEVDDSKKSWIRQLWQEGFRPLDEDGNVIKRQSLSEAPMRLASRKVDSTMENNEEVVTVDHKESIDPDVLAGNNPEFQKIQAEAEEANRVEEVDTAPADQTSSDGEVDPTLNAPAFGLTPEEAAAHEESNAVDDSGPASGSASVEEAPILAVEEDADDDDEEDDDEDRASKRQNNADGPGKRTRRRTGKTRE